MHTPIIQFGTSRFLLAHVDLFVDEALKAGRALGGISVVQTTDNPLSRKRVTALASGSGYPVRIRGLERGERIDREQHISAVTNAYEAALDWRLIRDELFQAATVVISNTADAGFLLNEADSKKCLDDPGSIPKSFPAKMLCLLHARWKEQPDQGPSIFPCELVSRNGDKLKGILIGLAKEWGCDEAFVQYLDTRCAWANSLVDRIVSKPIEPVGAVAEPYALWAIERLPGLVLPCSHAAITETDQLEKYERLKLWVLNLGHTVLAECWLRDGAPAGETVQQAMSVATRRDVLERIWTSEVLPVFNAMGEGHEASEYVATVRDRFLNPYLEHQLADIAKNHREKKVRRLAPVVEQSRKLGLELSQPQIMATLGELQHV
ncbi:mannitol dehydrogenase family protein [Paraburkholderia fynbosensis]|uniref:Altronate oxidoreductase n=1 Tax=Paraburkholderia fynbosensis TaxID=1200993 RepID=A0A6J5H0Z5_9BURK|nr:mannitol dehydrogenase family protein [Paraburkholderia fynbosensis]CAB3809748.1 Altronate oxidoreductase [Paraburkholderia fynbosensis]